MSKGDRDGRGRRHHKRCPELNCDWCVNGQAKLPARRAARRESKLEARDELFLARFSETVRGIYRVQE